MQKYHFIGKLGDGSYGLVSHAIQRDTGVHVAIKQIRKPYRSWDQCLRLNEIKSLQKIDHPNVIRLRTVLKVWQSLYLVFQYGDENLLQLIAKKRLSQADIKKIARELFQAIEYIHAQGFFHRDLKPENILLRKGVIKVCDFGLAKLTRLPPPHTSYVSTRWYRSPQQIRTKGLYGPPIDLFACGCILYEICTGVPLFPGTNDTDQLQKILKLVGRPIRLSILGIEGCALLNRLLQYDPQKRITAKEALAHPFLKENIEMPISTEQNVKQKKVEPQANEQQKNAFDVEKHKSKRKQALKGRGEMHQQLLDSWMLFQEALSELIVQGKNNQSKIESIKSQPQAGISTQQELLDESIDYHSIFNTPTTNKRTTKKGGYLIP